jgi:hypothetical protein
MPAFEKVAFKGWENCYKLSNGTLELIITGDVGPRIIHLGLAGGENMFAEFEEMIGQTGGDQWLIFGGHRFWHAPELQPRTYYPDTNPVDVRYDGGVVHVVQPTEPTTGIQKELDITLDDSAAKVTVVHRLRNHNQWAVELAPWALSVMDAGGTAIVPVPPRGSHSENLLPTHTITFWAYTNMADPRWTWGEKYVLLRQDPAATVPQKAGYMVPNGWTAYANKGNLFLKQFAFDADATYPDIGSNVETFTNNRMLELETLGALVKLQPGQTVEYTEHWRLFSDVPQPANDADVDAHILPLINA